ncbi:MAG: Protein-export membrane protein SecG [Syntrophorhabdaceae bacterium PtaU1.Bin034]|jgi:preprotein translocase subunit SecG|nr:MAG: Protein-export membrane protein SecG [Syntrophorhabdaceae bacterium PtaU1.Bin034]
MITAISIVHVLASIALVLIVLLQTGRGSEIGAAFGSGASQTLFGSSGTSGFMTRLTTIVVIVFMLTSLVLAIMYSGSRTVSVKPPPAPVEEKLPSNAK